jgi:hypothetical protein
MLTAKGAERTMAILQLAKKSKASEAAIISTRKIWLLL